MKKLEECKSSTIGVLWLGTTIIGGFLLGNVWGKLCNKVYQPSYTTAVERESNEIIDQIFETEDKEMES